MTSIQLEERRKVGGKVHALARHVQSESTCKRLYGSDAKTHHLNGTVLDITRPRPRSTDIHISFDLGNGKTKAAKLNLRSVHNGWVGSTVLAVATTDERPTTDATNTADGGLTIATDEQLLPTMLETVSGKAIEA